MGPKFAKLMGMVSASYFIIKLVFVSNVNLFVVLWFPKDLEMQPNHILRLSCTI